MKRGGIRHPKTLALAAALGVPRYAAVGILESLWHFAAQYALPGDVGRFKDAVIAEAIGWGEEPARLMNALVDVGWIEHHEHHRLVIHDWHEHADDGLRKVLRNRGQCFWNGHPPYPSRTVRESFGPVCAPQPPPQPQPLPQPQPQPQPTAVPPPVAAALAAPVAEDADNAMRLLTSEGITEEVARQLIAARGENGLLAVENAIARADTDRPRNRAGYIVAAIRDGYAPPPKMQPVKGEPPEKRRAKVLEEQAERSAAHQRAQADMEMKERADMDRLRALPPDEFKKLQTAARQACPVAKGDLLTSAVLRGWAITHLDNAI